MEESPDLLKEFNDWYEDAEMFDITYRKGEAWLKKWNYKNIANSETMVRGTYCKVFKDYYDENGNLISVKYTTGSKETMIELYFEYKCHLALWNMYQQNNIKPKVIKPLWFKKITLNRGGHCPTVAMGLERFDCTLWEYLKCNEGDTDVSRAWRKEIIDELKRTYNEWGFSHRDCHIQNIGIVNNEWKLYDLGMSILKGYEPYKPENGKAFYEYKEYTTAGHDERILRFSWDAFGDDDEWVELEKKKIVRSEAKFWKKNCPIVVKGHPLAENGTFLFVSNEGNVVVDLDVPETTKIKTITSKLRPPTKYEEMVPGYRLTCHFKKKDVLPDVFAEHSQYYFPSLD